jgi:citrate lyase beta subunit
MKLIRRMATGPVEVELMAENVPAVEHLEDLVAGNPEIRAVTFGGGDYLTDLGSAPTEALWQGKRRLVAATVRCGLPVYDTVFSDYSTRQPVYEDALRCAQLGFAGKSVIHPAQIPVTRQAFADAVGR